MGKPELGYWDIRGLAQPIRFLLEYTGTQFTDTQFVCKAKGEGQGDPMGPNWDRSQWLDVKFTKGLAFPNLPYFIDGDVKLTQTHAIMRHVARKHDLCGKTDEERDRCDMITEQCMDFRNGWVRLCYGTWEKAKDGYVAGLPDTLKGFEDFLGDNPWFAGQNLTFVDFHMYELLFQHTKFVPEIVAKCQKLTAFIKRFEELPKIKSFLESPRYVNLPMNNRMAFFGSTPL